MVVSGTKGLTPVDVGIRNNKLRPVFEGWKRYEISNHLGNVLAVVTDRKRGRSTTGTAIQWFEADVVSTQQYYPFGMLMPGNASTSLRRQYSLGGYDYRYGFNTQEKDNEVFNSNGTSYSAEYWQYDSRIGRRWNLDPKPNSSLSSYSCFANNPIIYSDYFGDTVIYGNNNVKEYIEKFTLQQTVSEKGKVKINKSYNKDFAEKVQLLDRRPEKFIFTDEFGKLSEQNGSILGEFNVGTEAKSFNVVFPDWTGSDYQNNQERNGGRSFALFEEVYHAYQFTIGDIYLNNSGKLSINSKTTSALVEAEAKIWAADRAGNPTFKSNQGYDAKSWVGIIRETADKEQPERIRKVAEYLILGYEGTYFDGSNFIKQTNTPPYKTY